MTKMRVMAIGLVSLFAATPVWAISTISIECNEADRGAQVFFNDKLVGECPEVMASTPPGLVRLRVRKVVDNEYEQLFEKELKVYDGTIQVIDDITLSSPQLTAEAIRNREAAEARKQLQAAESGNIEAMKKIAEYYTTGYGVGKNPAKAQEWRDKVDATEARIQLRAAESGDLRAMNKIAEYYATGFGVEKNPAKAKEWRDKIAAAEKQQRERQEAQKLQQEIEKTQKLESAANAGDIKAMKELSSRYILGLGVQKNYAKGTEWDAKYNEAIRLKEQQERIAKQRAAAQALVYEEEKKINEIQWTMFVEGMNKEMKKAHDPIFDGGFTTLAMCPVATAMDIVVTPTNGTIYTVRQNKIKKLKEEMERISSWGNPSSMIARSARNAETPNENNNLLAKVNN